MWKYWFGIHAALFFWEKKSSWEVWGAPRNKPKVLPWIAWYFNLAHRSMIWWFIFSPVGHPWLKNNHRRVQAWIQHQKCTNRAFYIEFNKEKNIWKYWFGIHAALFFWEKKSSWEVWGTPETNQRFYHGYPDILTWPTSPWFGDSSFHLLVTHG